MAQAASSLTLSPDQVKQQFRITLPFEVQLSGVKEVTRANRSVVIHLLQAVVKLNRISAELQRLEAQKKAVSSDYILSAGAVVEAKDQRIGESAKRERDQAHARFTQAADILAKKTQAADLARRLITRIQNANGIVVVSPKI
jgi:hypothetical protein